MYFCRLISIEFTKGTPKEIPEKADMDSIQSQINTVSPSIINKDEKGVQVEDNLFLTMTDKGVAQLLTNTFSSSTWTISSANSRQIRDKCET